MAKIEVEKNVPFEPDNTLESLKAIKENVVDTAAPPKPKNSLTLDEIERACQTVLDAMGTVDTVWRERIVSVREEKGWDATKTAFFLAGKTLNIGNHLENFSHHFFDDESVSTTSILIGKATCQECGKEFKPKNPGQKFCSNDCGDTHDKRELARTKSEAAARARTRRVSRDATGEAFSVGGPVDENLSLPGGRIRTQSQA